MFKSCVILIGYRPIKLTRLSNSNRCHVRIPVQREQGQNAKPTYYRSYDKARTTFILAQTASSFGLNLACDSQQTLLILYPFPKVAYTPDRQIVSVRSNHRGLGHRQNKGP